MSWMEAIVADGSFQGKALEAALKEAGEHSWSKRLESKRAAGRAMGGSTSLSGVGSHKFLYLSTTAFSCSAGVADCQSESRGWT